MANQSVLELAVGTGKWDAGLKKAKQSLDNFTQAQGGIQQALEKDSANMQKFVQMMGKMDSTAKTAKGQMNDYKSTIEQLTMQYNRMTDAQKRTVGKDYLQAIDQMKQKYQAVNEEIQEMNRSLNKVNETTGGGGFSDAMNGLTGKFFKGNIYAMAAEKGVEALQSLGQHVIDVTRKSYELAAASEGIILAFDKLNRPDLLDKLREATHGTVSDLELMKQAVKFNDFNLNLDEMGTLLAFAQQKAKDTGQSVDYMVDSIVTGLGRQSLMILDNLGLSAAEIKERMKEGGDMTTAVAAIIRDKMDEAGGYVETASDRMARSTAEVENAMLQLGNTMQETFDGTSIDEITNKLEMQLIAELNNTVECIGLVKDAFSGLGIEGNEVMDSLIGAISQTYHSMSLLLNPTMELLRLFNQFTGNGRVTVEGLHQGNEMITSPRSTKPVISPTKPRGGRGTVNRVTVPNDYASDSIAAQEKRVQELTKAWREASAAERDYIKAQLEMAKGELAVMNGSQKPIGGIATGQPVGVGGADTIGKVIEFDIKNIKTPLQELEDELKRLIELQSLFGGVSEEAWAAYQEQIDITQKKISKFKGKDSAKETEKSWNEAAQAISSVGSALQQIEDPSLKIAGIVGQAIAQIALGFAQATASDSKLGVIGWLAAIAGGMGTMLSTISAIHNATGYAQGGIVKGNSYSGDNMMFGGDGLYGLNAGELVLTKSQQSNLANTLQNSGGRSVQVHGILRGEDIILSANRTFKRKGQGEIVTW